MLNVFTLANGRLTLLTDGRSRNGLNAWSHDGRWIAYTRRSGDIKAELSFESPIAAAPPMMLADTVTRTARFRDSRPPRVTHHTRLDDATAIALGAGRDPAPTMGSGPVTKPPPRRLP